MSYADLNERTHEVALNRVAAAAPHPNKYVTTINPVVLDPKVFTVPVPSVTNRKPLLEVPTPVLVTYRFAASKEEVAYVAREVVKMQSRAVSVEAPPGVGKSTVMPGIIDGLVDCPVIVLEPTAVLAMAQADTVRRHGGKASYVDPCSAEFTGVRKAMGVVYMTPAGMLALLAREGKEVSDSSCSYFVIHDECHENDGATYSLRVLWPAFKQIRKYVLTSATLGSASKESLQRHNAAPPLKIIPCRFKEELEMTPSDKLPDGKYAPWSVYFLHGKRSLMFVEREKVAALVDALYSRFMPVKVLRRDSTYAEYLEVVEACGKAGPDGILVVVDSSYQTGYTFDVDVVVDFGIRRQTVDSGANQPSDQYRAVTVAERRQRVERVARTHAGVAYVPDTAVASSVSLLAPSMAGHVAAWCSLLGFSTPRNIAVSRPELLDRADYVRFFSSGLPWELWAREHYKERPQTVEEPVPVPVEPEAVVLDEEEELTAEGMFAWASQLRARVTAVELHSGEFYAMADGSVIAEPAVIEALAAGSEDIFSWLRERVCPKGVKLLSDASSVEASLIWSVWMTAWNNNVAKLIALKQWKKHYGVAADGWQGSPHCRALVANLYMAAEDVRDKWELLKTWYLVLFSEFPMFLKVTTELTELIDAQYRVIKDIFGVGASCVPMINTMDRLTERTKFLLTGLSTENSAESSDVTTSVAHPPTGVGDMPAKSVMAQARIEMADRSSTNPGLEHIPWGSKYRALRGPYAIRNRAAMDTAVTFDRGKVTAFTYVFPKKPGSSGTWR